MTVLIERLSTEAVRHGRETQVLDFGFYDRVEPLFVEAMCLLCDFNVKGKGNLPTEGNFILVSNHPSWNDPLLLTALMSLLEEPRVAFGGKDSLFAIPLVRDFLIKTHQFSVDRQGAKESVSISSGLIAAMEIRAANGMIIGLFPEATRTRGERLRPFHRGAALAAIKTGLPIVPVGIAYSRKLLKKTMYVTIGQPIVSRGRGSRDLNAELERTVAALFEESRARARA